MFINFYAIILIIKSLEITTIISFDTATLTITSKLLNTITDFSYQLKLSLFVKILFYHYFCLHKQLVNKSIDYVQF
jgi:hypothetical protein